MSSAVDSKVTIRLFLGTPLQSELRANLHQSPHWREAQLLSPIEAPLVIVWFHQKEYLGRYLPISELTVQELQESAQAIRQQIEMFCPRLDTKDLSMLIFPQLFIA